MSKPTTRIDAIGDNLYRISTAMPPAIVPGGFTFNQYLLIDEAPLLFHTGLRGHFDAISQAIATVIPLDELRYIAFCHANTRPVLERLAALEPETLACMHGSAYRGDGGEMLRELAERLGT